MAVVMKTCKHCFNSATDCQCRKQFNELAASALRRVRLAIKDSSVSNEIKAKELEVIRKELDQAMKDMK